MRSKSGGCNWNVIRASLAIGLMVWAAQAWGQDTPAAGKSAAPAAPPQPKVAAPAAPAQPKAAAEPAPAVKPPAQPPTPSGEAPAPKVPRSRYLELPGAPRSPIPEYDIVKELTLSAAEQAQLEKAKTLFDSLRNGKPIDRTHLPALDLVAKANIYELTRPQNRTDLSKLVGDRILRDLRFGPNEFRMAYKQALIDHAGKLLDNALVVRINMLLLVGELMDGKGDIPAPIPAALRDPKQPEGAEFAGPVPLFLKVLHDRRQPEAVHFRALRGVARSKTVSERGLIQVGQEREAVAAMLELARGEDPQEVFLEEIAATMGVLRVAFSGNVPEQAEAATYLADLTLSPAYSLRLRCVAAQSFGNLRVHVGPTGQPTVPGWNYELAGWVLGKTLRDLLSAKPAGEAEEKWFQWYVSMIRSALDAMLTPQANAVPIKALSQAVKPALDAALAGGDSLDLAALDQWLAQHRPKEPARLAPRADALRLPAEPVGEPAAKAAAGP